MKIINDTPFAVSTMMWEDLKGQAHLSVIVKATFSFDKGNATIADKQLPVFTTDKHYNDDPIASIRFESDMVPFKPHADIVLVGKAYSPGKRPVTQVDSTLRVGPLEKTIRVFGDRKWLFPTRAALVPVISRPEFFFTMDIVYEKAYGGIDPSSAAYCKENPIGKGVIGKKSKEAIHGKPLPNIEDPRDLINSWDSKPGPVGFGFYGRGWMPRLRYAGTYDEKYRRERAPAFPDDFSYALFNGAHPDLQARGYLQGNEEVEMKNLGPEAHLRFHLPGIVPKITATKWTEPLEDWLLKKSEAGQRVDIDQIPAVEEPVKPVMDTLVFMPDQGILYEVFRGVCPLTNLNSLEVSKIKLTF